MPKIYPIGSQITDADDIRHQFMRFGRDYYCDEVYQYIWQLLQSDPTDDVREFDVIEWCGFISWVDYHQTTNADGDTVFRDDAGDDYASIDDLASCYGDVIYHDAATKRIYYLE